MFVIANDLGEFEEQKIARFISGLKSEIRQDFELVKQLQYFLSLNNVITLALERKSWSNKVDNESGANIRIALSNHEKKHEHMIKLWRRRTKSFANLKFFLQMQF